MDDGAIQILGIGGGTKTVGGRGRRKVGKTGVITILGINMNESGIGTSVDAGIATTHELQRGVVIEMKRGGLDAMKMAAALRTNIEELDHGACLLLGLLTRTYVDTRDIATGTGIVPIDLDDDNLPARGLVLAVHVLLLLFEQLSRETLIP
jgi:hypothetical protein